MMGYKPTLGISKEGYPTLVGGLPKAFTEKSLFDVMITIGLLAPSREKKERITVEQVAKMEFLIASKFVEMVHEIYEEIWGEPFDEEKIRAWLGDTQPEKKDLDNGPNG